MPENTATRLLGLRRDLQAADEYIKGLEFYIAERRRRRSLLRDAVMEQPDRFDSKAQHMKYLADVARSFKGDLSPPHIPSCLRGYFPSSTGSDSEELKRLADQVKRRDIERWKQAYALIPEAELRNVELRLDEIFSRNNKLREDIERICNRIANPSDEPEDIAAEKTKIDAALQDTKTELAKLVEKEAVLLDGWLRDMHQFLEPTDEVSRDDVETMLENELRISNQVREEIISQLISIDADASRDRVGTLDMDSRVAECEPFTSTTASGGSKPRVLLDYGGSCLRVKYRTRSCDLAVKSLEAKLFGILFSCRKSSCGNSYEEIFSELYPNIIFRKDDGGSAPARLRALKGRLEKRLCEDLGPPPSRDGWLVTSKASGYFLTDTVVWQLVGNYDYPRGQHLTNFDTDKFHAYPAVDEDEDSEYKPVTG